jgi:hypothetical protein
VSLNQGVRGTLQRYRILVPFRCQTQVEQLISLGLGLGLSTPRHKNATGLFVVAACRGVLPITAGTVEVGGSKSSCSIINVGAGGGVRAVAVSWSLGPKVSDLLRKIDDSGKAKIPRP